MTEENKKNKEALDTNMSSAFLLYGNKKGFHITQECYDKIMSLELYSYNKKTGEEVLSKYLNYRAVCLVVDLHRISKENHINENNSKLYGRNTLREFSYKYHTQILDRLEENNIITIKRNNENDTREIWVNENCLSSEEIKLPKEYWTERKILENKKERRGNKCNSNNVYIDITKEQFMDICKDSPDFKEEKYLDLYKNIKKINKTGYLKPSQKYNNRCYSLFSNLPSKIHDRTYINGRKLSEVDGSATFFAFLPAVLDKEIKLIAGRKNNKESTLNFLDRLIKDTAKLRKIIKDTSDVYSLFVDETHTRDMIKTSFNSYLNDKKSNFMYNSIKKWFNENVPAVNTILRQFNMKNKFFYKIQQIEVEVYGYVARKLKEENIPVILKHDCILTYREYIEYVKKLLIDIMTKLNVTQKLKEKHYETAYGDPTDQSSGVCPDKNDQSSNIDNILPQSFGTPFVDDCQSLSGQNSRNRMINMKFKKDGRMSVSVKNVKYVSKKNDTLEDFKKCVLSKIDKEYEKLIIWTDERSECRNEETAIIKPLTTEIKETILKKDKKTVDLSLEVDFSQDVVKMSNDTKTPQKAPEEAKNDQYDVDELSDTIKLIIGIIK